MKISSEQIRILQESEARRKPATAEEGFGNLLAEQLQQGQTQSVVPAPGIQAHVLQGIIPAEMSQQIAGVGAVAATGATPASASVMDRMDDIFSNVEKYAGQLAGQNPGALRNAYSTLENMSAEIASLKSAHPDMDGNQPELAAMVNELDVLVQTEQFKFNRGDYL